LNDAGRGPIAHSDGDLFRLSRKNDSNSLELPRDPDGGDLDRAGSALHYYNQIRKTEADTDEHASLGWGGGQNGGGETERRNNRRSTETGSAANLCFNYQRSPSIREPKLT